MSPLAIFGITNDALDLAVKLLLLFLVVLWIALVYWTYADAKRRVSDPMLIACAAAASLFPFVGTVVYVVVRPPEYLEDVHERALEIAAAEARLAIVEAQACPYCGNEVEAAFLRCPSCLHRLKEPCATCGKPLDPRWTLCPYCEAEVGRAAPQARPRRERTRRDRPVAEAADPRQTAPASPVAVADRAAAEAKAPRQQKRAQRTGNEAATERPAAQSGEPDEPRPRAGGERARPQRS